MAKVKGVSWGIGLLLGLILVFTIAGNILPLATVTGSDLGRENSANCQARGCFWNASGTDTCVNVSTAPSGDCALTFTAPPLASLFSGTGIVFLLLGIALLMFVIARARR